MNNEITIQDANEIEIHMREIHAAANPRFMGQEQSARIRAEIACVRAVLAKVLVPVAGTSTTPGDLRLTRPDRLSAFGK